MATETFTVALVDLIDQARLVETTSADKAVRSFSAPNLASGSAVKSSSLAATPSVVAIAAPSVADRFAMVCGLASLAGKRYDLVSVKLQPSRRASERVKEPVGCRFRRRTQARGSVKPPDRSRGRCCATCHQSVSFAPTFWRACPSWSVSRAARARFRRVHRRIDRARRRSSRPPPRVVSVPSSAGPPFLLPFGLLRYGRYRTSPSEPGWNRRDLQHIENEEPGEFARCHMKSIRGGLPLRQLPVFRALIFCRS